MKKLLLTLSFILLGCQLAFGAAADMAVTVAGAGDGSGTAGDGITLEWDNAMSLAQWVTDSEVSSEAGDRYFIAAGTYTLTSDFNTARSGSSVAPISYIGVKAGTDAEPPTSADWAYGSDRPVIAATTWDFRVTSYWHIKNLELTTAEIYGMLTKVGCIVENCKSTQSSVSANYAAFRTDTSAYSKYIGCEGISTNGYAFSLITGSDMHGCYAHDSLVGVLSLNYSASIVGCVIDTCTTGISIGARYDASIINNTIYNCTTGISITTGLRNVVINNIIDSCTTGASQTADYKDNFWDYNSWDGDASSNVNITEGNHSIDSDITLGDPGNGDFTLGSGSACLDAGLQPSTNIGLTGDYKWNIGADQDDNTAAGGGSSIGWVATN